jgi:tripartite-type tricarboxylate transporter receptor subunit TctC
MRAKFVATVFAAMAVLISGAAAQDNWPSKPVHILVPFASGGTTDGITKLVIEWLRAEFPDATLTADNKSGSGGTVAASELARAAPDGYMLMMISTAQAAVAPAVQSVSYDPVKSFTPIKPIASSPLVVVVNAALPVKSVKELLAHAKSTGGNFSYASAGQGSVSHLCSALLFKMAGVEAGHVAYRGIAPALGDVISGQVGMICSTLSEALAHEKDSKVRLIAVSSAKRSPFLPELPTVEESGFKGFNLTTWIGLIGPAGVPADIVAKLEATLLRQMKDPAALEKMKQLGIDPDFGSSQDFAALIKRDVPLWADIVNQAGARMQ